VISTKINVCEPLCDSAQKMWEQARTSCDSTCRDYHASWQFLRLLKVISSIHGDRDFFLETTRQLARDRELKKILISAAADYGTLAHVLAACRAEGVEPEITLVDLCPTPLLNNQWYAERFHADVKIVQSDILTYCQNSKFDMVCTHSFLGRFSPTGREQLLRTWHDLLRPGGWVLTSKKVRPTHVAATVTYDDNDADIFVEKLRSAVLRYEKVLDVELSDLLEAGRAYVMTKFNYNLRSSDELGELFTCNGFELIRVDTPERLSPDVDPPSVVARDHGQRVRILARRK